MSADEVEYQLEKTFVWEKSPVGPLTHKSDVWLFSGIRTEGMVTGTLSHIAKMSFSQVMDLVETVPRYSGTREFFQASFWDCVAETQLSVDAAEAQVASLLQRHRIMRVSSLPRGFETLNPSLGAGSTHRTHYHFCLGLSLSEIRPLEIPGFLWALKRLCFHRQNWEILADIESRMDAWFSIVFKQVYRKEIFSTKEDKKIALQSRNSLHLAEFGEVPPFVAGAIRYALHDNRASLALTYYGLIMEKIGSEVLEGQSETGWSGVEKDARLMLIPMRMLEAGVTPAAFIDQAMETTAEYFFPDWSPAT